MRGLLPMTDFDRVTIDDVADACDALDAWDTAGRALHEETPP